MEIFIDDVEKKIGLVEGLTFKYGGESTFN